jgi:hypothetical protein
MCLLFSRLHALHAYSRRELRTLHPHSHTLGSASRLSSTETSSYANSASPLVSLQESGHSIATLHAYSESAHFCANAQKERRRLGVCISASGAVKCGWNMSIQPHRSLRWKRQVQLDLEFQMGENSEKAEKGVLCSPVRRGVRRKWAMCCPGRQFLYTMTQPCRKVQVKYGPHNSCIDSQLFIASTWSRSPNLNPTTMPPPFRHQIKEDRITMMPT